MVWNEGHSLGTEEEWAFKSRTYTGQVKGVDTANGRLTVELLGSRERYTVDAPVQGLSIRGMKSSWQRHMPQVRDYVDVSFGPDNRPHLVRMTSWMLAEDSGGWAQATAAAAQNSTTFGTIWRSLAQGEFDLRSAGGAGYYFSAGGHAVLEAGATVIELDKRRSESFGNAGLWVRRGDGVELRFGDVKRLLPGTFDETPVTIAGPIVPNPAGAPAAKEWKRTLSYLTPPLGVPVLYLDVEEAGDVRDDLGIPVLQSSTSLPLRFRRRLYDATGLTPALTVEVDATGNVKVTQGDLAVVGGLEVAGGALSPLQTSFFSATHETQTSMALAAGTTLDLGGDAGVNVNAGGAADSAMVRGDQLSTYLLTTLSVMTAWGPSGPAIIGLTPGVELSLLGKLK
ncbi:hypothetical protein Rctr197k_074 [Virus Rctr197k]|nr:hypothetical protein Rctr197k_074 [Virus Rctr197k]